MPRNCPLSGQPLPMGMSQAALHQRIDKLGAAAAKNDAVSTLREHQGKERQWHLEAWQKQEKHYGELDDSRREIDVRVRGIAEGGSRGRLRVVSRNR